MIEPTRYRRVDGFVFRRVRNSVLVFGGAEEWQRLEGGAAMVWVALAIPCSAQGLIERVLGDGPDVGEADVTMVNDARSMLEQAGLVVVDECDRQAGSVTDRLKA